MNERISKRVSIKDKNLLIWYKLFKDRVLKDYSLDNFGEIDVSPVDKCDHFSLWY